MATLGSQEEPQVAYEHSQRKPVVSKTRSGDFDPQIIWITIRHCWPWALPIGLALAAAAAFVVHSQFVPMYRATHLLEANDDYVVFKGVMNAPRNLSYSERPIIYHDLVLDPVVSDPEVQNALDITSTDIGKDKLRSNLRVSNAGVSSLLEIGYEDSDNVAAALVCNKITDSYLKQRARSDNDRVRDLEGWLTPSIDYWKSEVAAHEDRVRELSKTALGYDASQKVEGLENDLSILSSLRKDLAELIAEEKVLEARLAMRPKPGTPDAKEQSIEIPEPTSAEIRAFVSKDGQVMQIASLLAERETMMRRMDDQGLRTLQQDYYERLEKQAEDYREQLETAKQEAKKRAPQQLKSDWLELAERDREVNVKLSIASASAKRASEDKSLADLKARRAIIQEEYDVEYQRLRQSGGHQADLIFAQEDREVAVGILAQLNQRLAAIRTERRRGSGVQSLADAKPPVKPVAPMPIKNMIVAALGAFAIPFALGFLLEFRSQRICDAATIENRSLAPVVGEVAKLPAKVNSGRRQRIFEESIDTLRANLLLSKETRGVRTITIASSMSGEGKSSVASQLAISLAKACGRTVLLIDGDLRSPDQHDIFGLDMGPGLSKVMSGEVGLSEAVDRSLGDLVHVLPAGRMSMSPHRLLSSAAVRELLDTAVEEYAYVVFDTAPVLSAGETLAVASETDATLVCVMRDVSRTDTTVRSSRRLEAAGANVVGTVFSGVPSRQYAYRYGDYRYLNSDVPEA